MTKRRLKRAQYVNRQKWHSDIKRQPTSEQTSLTGVLPLSLPPHNPASPKTICAELQASNNLVKSVKYLPFESRVPTTPSLHRMLQSRSTSSNYIFKRFQFLKEISKHFYKNLTWKPDDKYLNLAQSYNFLHPYTKAIILFILLVL